MATEIEQIQLAAADTVLSVRERLSRLRGQRVLLILPSKNPNLRRKLDLVLIQREADRRAIQLAIVTEDRALRYYAAELNISSFDSVAASQQARWKRGRQKVFLPRYHKQRAALQQEDLEFIASRIPWRRQHRPWRAVIERVVVLTLLISAISLAIYVLGPGADLHISLQQERIQVSMQITADHKAAAVNAADGIIPARALRETVETSATIRTSGLFWIDSVSAAGVVSFSNLSDKPLPIPAGTILGTNTGESLLFETVVAALLPASQSVDVPVRVMEGYDADFGKLGSGIIDTVFGALAETVTVSNPEAFDGSNRSVKAVAAEDQNRLLESARLQLKSLAYEKMRATLGEDQTIVIESLQIAEEDKDWRRFSADIGTLTSELSLTLRAVVSALALLERDGRQVALARLQAQLPPNKELLIDTLDYARGAFSVGTSFGQASFSASAEATIISKLDGSALREQLAGISLAEAEALLATHSAISQTEPPQLRLYPPGLGRMPSLPLRISLRIRDTA